jgi:hypothetical protein
MHYGPQSGLHPVDIQPCSTLAVQLSHLLASCCRASACCTGSVPALGGPFARLAFALRIHVHNPMQRQALQPWTGTSSDLTSKDLSQRSLKACPAATACHIVGSSNLPVGKMARYPNPPCVPALGAAGSLSQCSSCQSSLHALIGLLCPIAQPASLTLLHCTLFTHP